MSYVHKRLKTLEKILCDKKDESVEVRLFYNQELGKARNYLSAFKDKHAKELFVGRFWKAEDNTYFYCKKIAIVDLYGDEACRQKLALVDMFELRTENNEVLPKVKLNGFDTNIHGFLTNCFVEYSNFIYEITREEYEAKLQIIAKEFSYLFDLDRKVLIEKHYEHTEY